MRWIENKPDPIGIDSKFCADFFQKRLLVAYRLDFKDIALKRRSSLRYAQESLLMLLFSGGMDVVRDGM